MFLYKGRAKGVYTCKLPQHLKVARANHPKDLGRTIILKHFLQNNFHPMSREFHGMILLWNHQAGCLKRRQKYTEVSRIDVQKNWTHSSSISLQLTGRTMRSIRQFCQLVDRFYPGNVLPPQASVSALSTLITTVHREMRGTRDQGHENRCSNRRPSRT